MKKLKVFIGLLMIGSLSVISYLFLIGEKLKIGTNDVVTDDVHKTHPAPLLNLLGQKQG